MTTDKQIPLYKVAACRETGEWLDEPEYVEHVSLADWSLMEDTEDIHYDTYQAGDPGDGADETRAIEVVWQS